jgi:hypothetical protein
MGYCTPGVTQKGQGVQAIFPTSPKNLLISLESVTASLFINILSKGNKKSLF